MKDYKCLGTISKALLSKPRRQRVTRGNTSSGLIDVITDLVKHSDAHVIYLDGVGGIKNSGDIALHEATREVSSPRFRNRVARSICARSDVTKLEKHLRKLVLNWRWKTDFTVTAASIFFSYFYG